MSDYEIKNIHESIDGYKELIEKNEKIILDKDFLIKDKRSTKKTWSSLTLVFAILFLMLSGKNIERFLNGYSFDVLTAFMFFSMSLFFYFLRCINVNKTERLENERDFLKNEILSAKKSISDSENQIESIKYQREIVSKVDEIVSDVLLISKNLPIHLNNIGCCLEQAEELYEKSQFAPFWDTIEETMNEIHLYYLAIEAIKENASIYHKVVIEHDGSQGELLGFPLDSNIVEPLSLVNDLESKMKNIIVPAQSNINFASIYEMRRTNQILIAGFNSFSSAINGLSDTLSSQLLDLGEELKYIGDALVDTKNEIELSGRLQVEQLKDIGVNQIRSNNIQREISQEISQIRKAYTKSIV